MKRKHTPTCKTIEITTLRPTPAAKYSIFHLTFSSNISMTDSVIVYSCCRCCCFVGICCKFSKPLTLNGSSKDDSWICAKTLQSRDGHRNSSTRWWNDSTNDFFSGSDEILYDAITVQSRTALKSNNPKDSQISLYLQRPPLVSMDILDSPGDLCHLHKLWLLGEKHIFVVVKHG